MLKGGRIKMRFASCFRLGPLLVLALGGILAFSQVASSDGKIVASRALTFEGSRAEAKTFMGYHRSIHLTREQEAIQREALEAIPAPCCSNFSAATCCCECNLTRTIWGLSNFLVFEKGFGVAQVRNAVNAWVQAVNPSGFTGDSCATGGCGRPFEEGGCGGMHESHLIFR
jgi:hypothetical protein